jgi:hypothetical protein
MSCEQALPGTVRAAPWSASQWCAYYRANAQRLLPLPWRWGAQLTDAERTAVAASIQDFQLGESSEGRNLLDRAAAYAEQSGDPDYLEAMRLFVGEEQRHAAVLGRYLDLAGIPRLQHSRLDGTFRRLRRLAGLETAIGVLLTAETVGKVYYIALRRATGCPLLRRICDQLLRDEVQHMRFHAERLAILRRDRARWRVRLAHGWHRLLFGGTCLLVWGKHRCALRAGGFGMGSFWRACWQQMNRVLGIMTPHRAGLPTLSKPREVSIA